VKCLAYLEFWSSALAPYKNFIDVFLAFVIGALGVVIAYRQYRLGKNQEQRDLWDRRMRVYDAINDYLEVVSRSGRPATGEIAKTFHDMTGEWRLESLFPSDVKAYIEGIKKKAHDLEVTNALANDLPAGEKQTSQSVKRGEIVLWMEVQRAGVLRQVLRRSLTLA